MRSMRRSGLVSATVFLLAGCIHRVPVAHLDKPTPVSVAYFGDRQDTTTPAPMADEVPVAVRDQLAQRNLVQSVVTEPDADRIRTTSQRLAALAKNAGAGQLVMLAELKVVYFDQMQGRFKWTVYVRLTMARADDLSSAVTREFDVPVFLRFDHEREHEALIEAAPAIGERAGQVADEFLGGRNDLVAPAPPAAQPASTQRERPRAIYFVMVDRFANGDPSNDGSIDPKDPAAFHGGDLQGVIDHLDDIQKLGVDTVWLSPVWKMRTEKFFGHGAFHGYWVEDFSQVEPRFGDRRLLRRLSDELHRRHMKLLLDVVLNHVAFDAPLVKQHPEWFHHNGEIKDWNDPVQLQSYDVMGLPDLAQERDDVFGYLLKTSEMWIDELQPDGFRLDAVKHVSPAFWKKYNAAIHAHAGKDFFLLGEDLDGDPAHLAKTATEDGFDAMFDFPLYFAIKDVVCDHKPLGRLASILSLDRMYPSPESLVTLVDNHDLPRIATACGDHDSEALALLLFLRGTPSVTYGTEARLTGAHEPENRADMKFGGRAFPEPALEFRHHNDLGTRKARVVGFGPSELDIALELSGHPTKVLKIADSGAVSIVDAMRPIPPAALRPVNLSVQGAPARAGDELRAVGAAPELGSWSPKHGFQIANGSLRLPDASVYELKFVVIHPDGKVEWESRENRYLFVPAGDGPLHVEATWNGS